MDCETCCCIACVIDFKLLGYSWKLAEIFKLSCSFASADLCKAVSPFHHCVIAWSVNDWSFFVSGIEMPEAV